MKVLIIKILQYLNIVILRVLRKSQDITLKLIRNEYKIINNMCIYIDYILKIFKFLPLFILLYRLALIINVIFIYDLIYSPFGPNGPNGPNI